MAFFTTNEDEEKKNQESAASGGGALRTAQAAAGPAAPGGEAGSAPAPAKAKGSGWTNLKSYIGANEGEGERMAGSIVSKVGEEAGKDVSTIGQQATTQTAGLSSYKPSTAAADYFADPTQIDATDFSKYYTQGLDPAKKSFDESAVAGLPDQWKQKADLASGGMSGRGAMASEYLARGSADYGGGKRNLDAFLLGGSSLGTGVAGKAQDVEDALVGARTNYSKAVTGKEKELAGAQDKFRELFTNARNAEAQNAYDAFANPGKAGMSDYINKSDMAGYMAAGQKADARERALAQLVGQDVAGHDWAGKFASERDKVVAKENAAAEAAKARAASGGPGSAAASVGVYAKPRTDPQAVMNNQAVNAADPTAGMSEDEQQAYLEKKYWEQQGS